MSIIRKAHNKENPYAQISRKTLQDKQLSLKALGLLARLLSFPGDWRISLTDLQHRCIEGKDGIRSAMNELIKHKYIERKKLKDEKGFFYDHEYLVHEQSYEDQPKEVKNRKSDSPTIGKSNTTKEYISTKEDISKENISKDMSKKIPKDSAPPSPVSHTLTDIFIWSIQQNCPNFKVPNKLSWAKEIDKMIRLDKRKPEDIKTIINYLPTDDFWFKNILSASKLRKQFDRLWLESSSTFAQADKFRRFAWKVKKECNATNLIIKKMSVIDTKLSKDLVFNIPYRQFCETLVSWYGAQLEEGDLEE